MNTDGAKAGIDVIIPVYNTDPSMMERCIKSILDQTYSVFSILLINDGSKDACVEMLERIEKLDPRIALFHKENGGPASARNFGINRATSKYVTFVDADDQIPTWFLQDAVSSAEESGCDFIIGGNIAYGSDFSRTENDLEIIAPDQVEDFIPNVVSSNLIRFDYNGYIGRGPWARIILRDLANNCQFDESLFIAEDICWNIDVLRKAERVGLMKNIWYIYSIQPFSITKSYNPKLFEYIQKGIMSIESRIDKENQKQVIALLKRLREEIHHLSRSYYSYLANKEKKVFRAEIYEAYPWTLLGEADYVKKGDREIRFTSMLYRTRLILMYAQIRERLKRFKNSLSK